MVTLPALFNTPNNDLVYVIGDAQGQLDLLDKMVEVVKTDSRYTPTNKIVLLGNFLHNKNTNNRLFIQRLKELKDELKDNLVIIRGRNEHSFVTARAMFFKSELGRSIIKSYRVGFNKNFTYATPIYRSKLEKGLNVQKLTDDICWVRDNTVKFFDTHSYFICSAGISPLLDINAQNTNALMYMGTPFLTSNKKFEKVVVHGSEHVDKVQIKHNRINVNTHPETSRLISCVVLATKKSEVEEVLTVKG
jgi:serine/threonine protein phosphatase 1